MTKEKIVSGMFYSKDFFRTEMWRVKNAAYEFIDAKAKKRIKEIGFHAWLGTLPKPVLLEIRRKLAPDYTAPSQLCSEHRAFPYFQKDRLRADDKKKQSNISIP